MGLTAPRTFDGPPASYPVSAPYGVSRTARAEEGGTMHAIAAGGLRAECPLCGGSILTVGHGGHLDADELYAVPLHRRGRFGEGFTLCDECGMLADLPPDVTLN